MNEPHTSPEGARTCSRARWQRPCQQFTHDEGLLHGTLRRDGNPSPSISPPGSAHYTSPFGPSGSLRGRHGLAAEPSFFLQLMLNYCFHFPPNRLMKGTAGLAFMDKEESWTFLETELVLILFCQEVSLRKWHQLGTGKVMTPHHVSDASGRPSQKSGGGGEGETENPLIVQTTFVCLSC